ncbi:MAG TPA: methyltransferase domain-containing protein [Rhizomicrobium sp.]|jgi:predicted methyltransferase
MRKFNSTFAATIAAVALFAGAGVRAAETTVPDYIVSAVNDPARATDVPADARRHVAEIAAFAKIKPGESVVDLIPGSGYFTRVFAKIVGPNGHVYDVWPDKYASEAADDVKGTQALAQQPAYSNVSAIVQPATAFQTPAPVDVVFTSQNLHDYPDKFMGNIDITAFCKQVYAALKPGGVFLVIDHVAEAGSGLRDTDTLHRIDPAAARAAVEAAGFKFDGESDVLRNPADDHKKAVFDKTIRGHTDQFTYRFVKPE